MRARGGLAAWRGGSAWPGPRRAAFAATFTEKSFPRGRVREMVGSPTREELDMPGPIVNQVPVEAIKAGLYSWQALIGSTTYTGHVVVRGPDAKAINGWGYPAGSETWYLGASSSGGAANPTFLLTLAAMAAPTDQGLITAISAVRNTETDFGEVEMIPKWEDGAPLGKDPLIYTLTDVTGGTGQYSQLYDKVSFQMPMGTPQVLPTWYTEIPGLASVFGGDAQNPPIIQVGIEAKLTGIGSSDPGYPDASSWYWFGRDPS
jgi:hypothetical protein